jgi:hypothetical protein
MKFETIAIVASQADQPDPRSTPATVPPGSVKETPKTLNNTDETPTVAVLALEGTAADTVHVQPYAIDETKGQAFADDPTADNSLRTFYAVAAAVTVTVGTLSYCRAVPGRIYWRITSAPSHAATLKIGFATGSPS